MQIKMQFTVTSVTNQANPVGDMVELEQSDPLYVNPAYRGCRLTLGLVSDDELKRFGPGAVVQATLDFPG